MARVPLVQDDDEAARATGLFETFKDEGLDPSDIFRALANVPGLMMAHRALPRALRGRESCPPRLRELAVLRLAQLVGSAYEWSHHRPMALAAGVTAEQAAALAGWRASAVFSAPERLVLAAAEAVHQMAVTDELFGALEAGLGRAGTMELIVVISQYEAVARIIQALGVEVEADHKHHLIDWAPRDQPGPVHLILYVSDQVAATAFWRAVLDRPPALDVPGMTEFTVGPRVVLGLMPETGIRSLLGPSLPDPAAAHGIPRAELYLVVDDAAGYHARARAAGASELSPLTRRSWGDDVAYCLDPDGHVVAFATRG